MTNSRNKGAQFERKVAQELLRETGITFKRNLDQYQERGHGDLTPDNAAFPFTIECKALASGTYCKPAWEVQAFEAAIKAGKHPAVIYKFNNHPITVRIWFDAMAEGFGTNAVCGGKADLSIQDFAWVAREIMSRRAIE